MTAQVLKPQRHRGTENCFRFCVSEPLWHVINVVTRVSGTSLDVDGGYRVVVAAALMYFFNISVLTSAP